MTAAAAYNPLVRRLRAPGYLILVIAMMLPLIDLVISLSPLRPATLMWRFGAVGLLASAIGAPLLVLFLIYVLAYLSGDRGVIIAVAVLAVLIAVFMLGGAGTFALDALQMKRRVPDATQSRFMVASGQALFKMGLQGLAALVLGVSAFRTFRATKTLPISRPSAAMLVNRPSAARPVPGGDAVVPPPTPRAAE